MENTSALSLLKRVGGSTWGVLSQYKIFLVWIVLAAGLSIASPSFLTANNLVNILRQISINAIVAVGFTAMLISGSIDLSIGSVLGFTGMVAAMLIKAGVPISLSILICLCTGALLGLITGVVTNYTKINAFIATLAFMQVYRGATWLLCGGPQIFAFPQSFLVAGEGYLGPIPVPVIIMLAAGLVTAVMLNQTKFGRNVSAVGGNPTAARVSGINIMRTSIMVFVYLGVMCALAGIVTTARMNMATGDAGTGIELDTIAAVVIGGTSLFGGKGTVMGSIIGCLLVGTINNGLVLLDVSPYVTMVAKGVLILIAVILDSLSNFSYFTRRRTETKKESAPPQQGMKEVKS